MTTLTSDKTSDWCKQRLERLSDQNRELKRKIRDIEKRLSAYKTKESEMSHDLKTLKSRAESRNEEEQSAGLFKFNRATDFKQSGRAGFLGIGHHVDAARPVPSKRSNHQRIPTKILRQIETEENNIRDLSLQLKDKNNVLRRKELDCQTVELECRDEMEKIAEMVGKKVLHSILLHSPSSSSLNEGTTQSGTTSPSFLPADPVDPSLRLVKRGNWR